MPADFEATEQNVHAFAIAKLVNYWKRAEEESKRTGEPFVPEFPTEIYLVDEASIEPLATPEPTETKFKMIKTPKA